MKAESYDAGSRHGGPNWYDSVRYCGWLSDQLGYGESQAYRAESSLPE